uniref:Reverse transcriptase domain-containing protein n=1 Tax=Tanacetum cinerariifolium TaxID=118510 RepID=A0A6L2KGB2_TANCI|nr:hypothetical protein [Tanacetum cinerariifolium]
MTRDCVSCVVDGVSVHGAYWSMEVGEGLPVIDSLLLVGREILFFLVMPGGFDPLALVELITPVEGIKGSELGLGMDGGSKEIWKVARAPEPTIISSGSTRCVVPLGDLGICKLASKEENFKIYSNPLFEFDDEYIFSDVNPLFNEMLEDIKNKDSYVFNFDEPSLLVTPLSDASEDECFDPGGDIDEIDAFLDIDISTDIEDGYHDSEGDIIYFESLLINDTIPNLPPKVFLDHDQKSLNDEPDNDDFKSMVKVFDPAIHEKNISPTYVRLPFEESHYFSLTFVIRCFLPYLTYSESSPFLLSSGSEDTIFDPGILLTISIP